MLQVLFHWERDLYCGASWFSKGSVIPLYHSSVESSHEQVSNNLHHESSSSRRNYVPLRLMDKQLSAHSCLSSDYLLAVV